jgi:hypothetical protein
MERIHAARGARHRATRIENEEEFVAMDVSIL